MTFDSPDPVLAARLKAAAALEAAAGVPEPGNAPGLAASAFAADARNPLVRIARINGGRPVRVRIVNLPR